MPLDVSDKVADGAATGIDHGKDGHQSNNSVIEISSDDEENSSDDDDGSDNKDITANDFLDSSNTWDNLKLKSSFNYPGLCKRKSFNHFMI